MSAESMEALQRLLFVCVTHPDGVAAGAEEARARGLLDGTLEDAFPDNARLSGAEQVGIYAFMYLERLLDVLRGEYPSLVLLFGERSFAALARAYLVARPSRSWSLDALSVGLPGWLSSEAAREVAGAMARWLPFAVDVARVERALEDIVDDAPDTPVGHDALRAIPPDQWGALRLRPIAGLRLLRLAHPVGDWLDAARDERRLEPPGPAPSSLLVHRVGYARRRRPLGALEARLLQALCDGHPIDASIDASIGDDAAAEDALMAALPGWFEDWFRLGLFTSLGRSPVPGSHPHSGGAAHD